MSEKYDVAIIGAGIGGLVCGCYLAKAGLKVIIVEQHSKPGGYCTSFERNGYRFDVGVHYLGSLREQGVITQILKDLELQNRINFITNDPTDRIITPDKTIFIRRDKEETKKELINNFHKEKQNIINFFNFILMDNFLHIVSKTKTITFKALLDKFFHDYKLKAVLSIPLGNLGLPASKASALVSIILYREYILDGGYYPKGGIQIFPDALSARFKEYGGKLLLSTRATKIFSNNKEIKGIEINQGEVVLSKYVVSNADATSTFNKLLDCKAKENRMVKKLKTSHSAFVIYLGLKEILNIKPKHYTTWFFSTYDIDKCYDKDTNLLEMLIPDYFLCTFSSLIDHSLSPKNKSVVRILLGANYEKKIIWDRLKENIYKKIIEKVNILLPNIQNQIEIKEIATPYSFYRFTSNANGAMYGWASVPAQIDKNLFPPSTSIKNLYLSGHWTTNGIGQASVSLVALCGKNVAKLILRKNKL